MSRDPELKSENDFPGGAPALAAVATALARQAAMDGAVRNLAHGSRLFRVAEGWQSRVLAEDPRAIVCATLLELDRAMQDETKRVIFLPWDAMMTADGIETVCRRHGATKTLFWEERLG